MEHRLNDTGQGKTEVVLLELGWDGIRVCAVRALPENTGTMARLFSFIKILAAIYCGIHTTGNRIANVEWVFIIWRYE